MAFAYTNSKGTTYYLHGREVELNNDHQRTIYFFAKDAREGALDQVPEGWQVMEGRNALPVLSKGNGDGGKSPKSEPKSGGSPKSGDKGDNSRGSGAGGRGGGTGSSGRRKK
jgi:hypothetical protein